MSIREEDVFPMYEDFLPEIDHAEQIRLMVEVCNNARGVFALCKDICDPDEDPTIAKGIPARAGGFLLVGTRKDGKFSQFPYRPIFLGKLTEDQIQNGKLNIYRGMARGKCNFVARNPYSADARATRFEINPWGIPILKPLHTFATTPSPLVYGAVESQDSQIIIGFSGFLDKKDELFVLSLAIISKVLTIDKALEIAQCHDNHLFISNMAVILANWKKKELTD